FSDNYCKWLKKTSAASGLVACLEGTVCRESSLANGVASSLRQQPANEIEVGLHVFAHIAGRRHGFQLRPAAEPGLDNGANDLWKINLALTDQVRIVLQVEFADPVFAQPPDFLVDVEPVVERVAHIIINQHGFRVRAIEDARVVLRGDRVFQTQYNAGLFRLRPVLFM